MEIKVSVIIPVYNQNPEYFQEAVESVINQTIKPYEIIIVDDGSDFKYMKEYNNIWKKIEGREKIKFINNEENMGIGYSRKRGVDEATGDYIAQLSSDDVWDERFLEVMIKTAEKYPDKILYSTYYFINENGEIINIINSPNYEDHEDFCMACWVMAEKNTMFVNFSTTFFPKKVFEKIKFDKDLRYGEDLDFLLKSMKHFEYQLVNQPLLKYRSVGNLTSRIADKIPKNNEVIRKKCKEYWKCQK